MDLVLEPGKDRKKSVLADMNLHFSGSIEVLKIAETAQKNVLQVVAIDHDDGIFTILTWNFDENVEICCK
jgi:hypothetical protein